MSEVLQKMYLVMLLAGFISFALGLYASAITGRFSAGGALMVMGIMQILIASFRLLL